MKDTADTPNGQAKQSPGEITLDYLVRLDPDGTHALAAIDPTSGAIEAATFPHGRVHEIPAWVNARNGRLNLYYSANEPRADMGPCKAGKADIVAVRVLHVDIDPPAGQDLDTARADILAKLGRAPVPFTEIIDSGGGYQALVVLDEKMPATPETREWAEGCNRALRDALGGDNAQNIDRILRLPGTENIPDARKREKGRAQRTASVLVTGGARIDRGDIAQRIAPVPASQDHAGDGDVAAAIRDVEHSGFDDAGQYDALPHDLRARFDRDMARHPDLAALWQDGRIAGADKSGSALRFKLAGVLKGIGGYAAEDYAALAWVWKHPGLQSRPGDRADMARQMGRDWARAEAWTPGGLVFDVSKWFRPEPAEPLIFETPAEEGSAPNARRALSLKAFDDVAAMALDLDVDPLIDGLLDKGASSVVYGASNTGKTFVVLDMAFAIASGRPWDGRETTKAGVLYLALEGGAGIRKRFAALRRQYPDADASRLMLAADCVDLCNSKDDAQAVTDAALSIPGGCGLIVIDTLARALAGGDENSAVDMGKLIRSVDYIRAATGAHVLLIHHAGKDATRGARGHSSLKAAVDTEMEITENMISNPKQRDREKQADREFGVQGVHLGTDRKGRPVTSAVVRFGAPEVQPAERITTAEKKLLGAMRGLMPTRDSATAKMLATALGDPDKDDAVRKQADALVKKGYFKKLPDRGAGYTLAPAARFEPVGRPDPLQDPAELAPENVIHFPAARTDDFGPRSGKSGHSTSSLAPTSPGPSNGMTGTQSGTSIFD